MERKAQQIERIKRERRTIERRERVANHALFCGLFQSEGSENILKVCLYFVFCFKN